MTVLVHKRWDIWAITFQALVIHYLPQNLTCSFLAAESGQCLYTTLCTWGHPSCIIPYIFFGVTFFIQILLIINCILVFLFLSETKCINCFMICKEDSEYCNRCIFRRFLEVDDYFCKYSIYLSILNISLVKSLKFVSMRQFFFWVYFHIKWNGHQYKGKNILLPEEGENLPALKISINPGFCKKQKTKKQKPLGISQTSPFDSPSSC